MSGHIAWRDDIRRTCQCGHAKGNHGLPPNPRCLVIAACPCPAFQCGCACHQTVQPGLVPCPHCEADP